MGAKNPFKAVTSIFKPVVSAISSVVGGVVGGILGINTPEVPDSVSYEAEAAPREQEQEAEASNVRDEEKRKLRQRRLMGGTVLTSPLGVTGSVASTGASLLGRSNL